MGFIDQSLAGSLEAATALNPYGVEVRYPGDTPNMTFREAEDAVLLAALVREAIREHLQVR